MATLTEIETSWDINDLFDAHEILDVKEEMAQDIEKKTHSKR